MSSSYKPSAEAPTEPNHWSRHMPKMLSDNQIAQVEMVVAAKPGTAYGVPDGMTITEFNLAVRLASAHLSTAKETIADEAKRIVTGARRGSYGKPERNFERIALFWTAYFKAKGVDIVITATDVSPMMRLMKEARLVENPTHRDSFVDIIGYALTGAEINGVDSSS